MSITKTLFAINTDQDVGLIKYDTLENASNIDKAKLALALLESIPEDLNRDSNLYCYWCCS